MWNLMDWAVYSLYILVFFRSKTYVEHVRNPVCGEICTTIGFIDDHVQALDARWLKYLLALCVCVQLLKIMKISSILVPKMGLTPSVLKKALPDMIFFSLVFAVSLFAFSNMLFIQLGTGMKEFSTQFTSLITLGRALFGDFDMTDVISNSPNCASSPTLALLGRPLCPHGPTQRPASSLHPPQTGTSPLLFIGVWDRLLCPGRRQHDPLPALPLLCDLRPALHVPRDARRGAGQLARRPARRAQRG